eukprot:4862837-Pyramimonas_sp.AAC.1
MKHVELEYRTGATARVPRALRSAPVARADISPVWRVGTWRLKPLSAPVSGSLHTPQPHVVDRHRGRCGGSSGTGASAAGAVASVACPALADDAGCPAGVVIGAAVLFIIIAVAGLSFSRRPLGSLAPRSISS